MNEKGKYKKILIVDDSKTNLDYISKLLKSKGYLTAIALNGNTALKKAKAHVFDLVLLDIIMPEIDGFEVCRQLKNNPSSRSIPIIFLTSKTDAKSLSKGFEIGGVDYIKKPFNTIELLARVETHLNLKKAQDTINSQNQELENANILLEKQNQELLKLNATKDRLFSIIGHDLKNPFNAIIGFSQLLKNNYQDYDSTKQKEIINSIYQAGESAYNLLTNLLEWARMQSGHIDFKPRNIELKKIIDNVVMLYSGLAKEKGINLFSGVITDMFLFADENMLSSTLQNLISNALKFTPEGGTVHIMAKYQDENVEVTVSDNGLGMKAEDLKKLFKIEENFTKHGTNGEFGTGLGLLLCKDFVEKNGGSITVESTPKEGSDFIFTIPSKEKKS